MKRLLAFLLAAALVCVPASAQILPGILAGSPVAAGCSDPNWANVVFLAGNDNAANGTTTFLDQSSAARATSRVGTPAYSNVSAPTGMTTSILLNGSTDYLTSLNSADFDFGSGDFTVELYVNMADVSVANQEFAGKDNVSVRDWNFLVVSGQQLRFQYWKAGSLTQYIAGNSGASAGVWYHAAVVRSGGSLYIFWNGVQIGVTGSISGSIDAGSVAQSIGAVSSPTAFLNGYLASLRITKGVARYTANFTPPSLPLPHC